MSIKPEARIRYNRTWTLEQKRRIMTEVCNARASGKYGAIARIREKYLIRVQHISEWTKDLKKYGLWDDANNRPKGV